MTFPPSVTTPPPRAPRPILITVVAWLVIVGSAILLPISVISTFMVLAGSYGTANVNLVEGSVVILGPPVTFIAGIGLLRRWRWSWVYMLAVLIGFVVWSAGRIIKGPSPARTTTSANGTRITVSATEVNHRFHGTVIVVSLGLFTFFLSSSVRSAFGVGRRRRPTSGLESLR